MYVLDMIRGKQERLSELAALRITSHFAVTDEQIQLMREYVLDSKNMLTLNAIKKRMQYSYNHLKAILLIAFLS